MHQKIVLTGAPSTGKSTTLNLLLAKGYFCMEEVSREIIKKAQKTGIEKLFLSQPILFSEMLLKKRIEQYQQATTDKKSYCFFDRGIPDITAYLKYNNTSFDDPFKQAIEIYTYDLVFVFPPWKQIYTQDNERLETYEEALAIHKKIIDEYQQKHQQIIIVPIGTPKERVTFILQHLNA